MATLTLKAPHASFPVLLARYMRGEIGDPVWSRLMQLLDASDVTGTERIALARFVNELVDEGGPEALSVPLESEAQDLLQDTRN